MTDKPRYVVKIKTAEELRVIFEQDPRLFQEVLQKINSTKIPDEEALRARNRMARKRFNEKRKREQELVPA